MLGAGLVFGIANGKIDDITDVFLSSSGEAVQLCIGILGVTAFWCGMINILQEAGIIDFAARILRPIIYKLFPETKHNKEAGKQIITNISANLFGLGNGATPSGISAVRELQKENLSGDETVASDSVCLFLVINATAFQLIPTTVIAILADAGSHAASAIIVPVWIVSLVSMFAGILTFYVCKLFRRGNKVSCSGGNKRK